MTEKSTISQATLASNAYPLAALLQALPPLSCLQAMLAVAELGSLSRAARQLHRTQGAVSRQIQQLESCYGAVLFSRSAQGMTLNAAGQQVLPDVRQVLTTLAGHFSPAATQPLRIRLQVPTTLGLRWLLPRMDVLANHMPGLDVQLATHNADRPQLAELGCDAAIVRGGSWPGLSAARLFAEKLLPVCAPSLQQRLQQPADLLKLPLLHPEQGCAEWQCWLAALSLPLPVAGGRHFDSQEMALSAAVLGQGVAVADPRMLTKSLASGELAVPFAIPVSSGQDYQLMYPALHANAGALAALARVLTALDDDRNNA